MKVPLPGIDPITLHKVILYFDGSCLPKNPGGVAGFAWRLLDETGLEIASDSGEVCRGPTATNNVAEWAAVRNGLRYLKSINFEGEVEIRGDSQLVIYQLDGTYKVRKPTLLPFYTESLQLLGSWVWKSHWIPREENKETDKLSRLNSAG